MSLYRPQSFYSSTIAEGLTSGGSETTLSVSTAPNETAGYLVINKASSDSREIVKYTGVSGTTLSGLVRGLAFYTTTGTALSESAVSANKKEHSAGETIEMCDVHYYMGKIHDVVDGLSATDNTTFKVGDGTDDDIYYYAYNADSNKPYIKYDKTNNKWVFASDGVNESNVGGASLISAGDGIAFNGGDCDVDLATTPGLEFDSAKLRVKIKTNGGITRDSDGLSVDQSEDYTWSGTNDFTGTLQIGSATLTSTAAELNKLDGTSATVTATNLNSLTGAGQTALHYHQFICGQDTRTAAEGSGTQTITTGFQPRLIQIFAVAEASGDGMVWSQGCYDLSNYGCVYSTGNIMYDYAGADRITYLYHGAGNAMEAEISSTAGTSFTLTWTKTVSGYNVAFTYMVWG